MNHEMMMARVKKYLSSKQDDIEFADIIEKWGTEAYNQITEVAHYNFQLSKEAFERYLEIHLRAIAPLFRCCNTQQQDGEKSGILNSLERY